MIVKVCYRGYDGRYGGRDYAYNTTLPLKVGDKVVAPTYKGDSPALVTAADVDPATMDESILRVLKVITEYYIEEADE